MEAQAKVIRVHPIMMAEIYFNRMHFSAIKTVKAFVNEAPENSEARQYWGKVLEVLKRKVEVRTYD